MTAPYLRIQGSATQLIVDGAPFLILGGELHNSSSSSLEYMQPIWERMTAMHFNTVLVAVSWELIEPEEGHFDFTLVDGLLRDARSHGLRLILLWFGSWKNGMSSYIPLWVKRDTARFPRATLAGRTAEVLSTLAEANWQADARAFAALMSHVRDVDSEQHTVIMVQVENEVGVMGDSRDRSALAEQAFSQPVPQELISHLIAHRDLLGLELRNSWEAAGAHQNGTWAEVFGASPTTDEYFMAWQYARYVDHVTTAGKAAYSLPMFVNAWLSHQEPQHLPGDWPSGGPLPHVLDIWLAGAPQIDLLTPDIYAPNFEQWCQRYTRRSNPLFIPEMRRTEDGARQVFYAIGQHDAIGTSPFAVDSLPDPGNSPLAQSYAALQQVAPLILANQGQSATAGFLLNLEHPNVTRQLGGYELEIALDTIFIFKAEIGYGLIIATGPETFVGVGSGFQVTFRPLTPGPAIAGIAAVDEGEYRAGAWVPGRRLNGDENAQGVAWRFSNQRISIQHCSIYRYE
jgi:beta-galactosidase GanA